MRSWLILGALSLGALVLRLVHLSRFELWVDEAASWYLGRLAAGGRLFELVALEPNPPLYFLLLGVFLKLFGESDFALRLPSVLAGVAAVPAVYALALRFFGRRPALFAAGLLAIHPLHVFYSREARVYPFLLLTSVLLWLVLKKVLGDDRPRLLALYVLLLLIAFYSHFYGLFLLATAGVILLARRHYRALVATALAALLIAPYLVMTLPRLEESGVGWWLEAFYERYPEERRFGRTVEMGFFGAGYHELLREISSPPTPPLLRAASLLVQMGLLAAAFAGARRRDRTGDFVFLFTAWLLPLLLPWALHYARPLHHTGRHDFYVVGTLMVLLAAGLEEVRARASRGNVRGRWRRWGYGVFGALAVVVILLAAAERLTVLYRPPAGEMARKTGEWVAHRSMADDRVVAMGLRRYAVEHYARLAGSAVRFASFPRSTDDHPGWTNVDRLLEDEGALGREARERIAALEREMAPGATLFVLLRSYRRTATAVSAEWRVDRHWLENLAAAGFRPLGEKTHQELGVAAFVAPASAGGSR